MFFLWKFYLTERDSFRPFHESSSKISCDSHSEIASFISAIHIAASGGGQHSGKPNTDNQAQPKVVDHLSVCKHGDVLEESGWGLACPILFWTHKGAQETYAVRVGTFTEWDVLFLQGADCSAPSQGVSAELGCETGRVDSFGVDWIGRGIGDKWH